MKKKKLAAKLDQVEDRLYRTQQDKAMLYDLLVQHGIDPTQVPNGWYSTDSTLLVSRGPIR